MTQSPELDTLAQRLVGRSANAQAVMIVPVTPTARAGMVCRRLAAKAARLSGRPSWIIDLDFARNAQSSAVKLNGQAFAGELSGEAFWRVEPHGAGRLALRKAENAPVFISRFERQPGQVRRVVFHTSPRYWELARQACGLALVDGSAGGSALASVVGDLDGVILAVDATCTPRSEADRLADQIEAMGGQVLGAILTEPRSVS